MFYSERHLRRVLKREEPVMYKVELTLAAGELKQLIYALETGIVTSESVTVRQQLRNLYRKLTRNTRHEIVQ